MKNIVRDGALVGVGASKDSGVGVGGGVVGKVYRLHITGTRV